MNTYVNIKDVKHKFHSHRLYFVVGGKWEMFAFLVFMPLLIGAQSGLSVFTHATFQTDY